MQVCPNCGEYLVKVKENVFYCPDCDETYAISKGKPVVTDEKKTVIEAMSDKIKQLCERVDEVEAKAIPKNKNGIFSHLFD